MKFKKSGQVLLALAVSLGLCLSVTSCTVDYTAAYIYVTGQQYNQIGAFKMKNDTGNLSTIPGSPFGSGGTNPVRELISSTGRYLYVLNAGTLQGDGTYSGGNIAVFSVGGNGVLAPQQTYTSQGNGSIRMGFSASGTFLYILDQYAPTASGVAATSSTQTPAYPCPAIDASGDPVWRPVGDITAFAVNATTGRLSLITNSQQQDSTGAQLTYFPVGCNPIDFKVSAAYIFTADAGPEPTSVSSTANTQTIFEYALNGTSGQLTLTQNAELVTNASKITNLGADAASKYIYVIDGGINNQIFSYTIGTNGVLQSVTDSPFSNNQSTAGSPIALTSDSKSLFLFVANEGPSGTLGQASSNISAYTIASNGVLAPISGAPFATGSGPQCIFEDPTNQYIFTADFTSSTVTGHVLDPNSGNLTDLRNHTSYATVGNPTWCVASGHTD